MPDPDLEADYRDGPPRPPVNPTPVILALAGFGLFLVGAIVVCALIPMRSQTTLKVPAAVPTTAPEPGPPEAGPMPREVRPSR